jgi:rhodanese-related sulfurtransferase
MTDATYNLPTPGKSAQLVAEADAAVGHIGAETAKTLLKNEDTRFIDVRDIRELPKTGRIPGAKHCPRGMLEFWIDPQSPYHKPLFAEDVQFVFYCASGWRSALAAQTAKTMGLSKVTHLKGGISAWVDAGLPVEER